MKATKKQLLLNHVEANGGKITWHDAVQFLLSTKGMTLKSKDVSRGHYSSYFSDSIQARAIMSYPSKGDNRYLAKENGYWVLKTDNNYKRKTSYQLMPW